MYIQNLHKSGNFYIFSFVLHAQSSNEYGSMPASVSLYMLVLVSSNSSELKISCVPLHLSLLLMKLENHGGEQCHTMAINYAVSFSKIASIVRLASAADKLRCCNNFCNRCPVIPSKRLYPALLTRFMESENGSFIIKQISTMFSLFGFVLPLGSRASIL